MMKKVGARLGGEGSSGGLIDGTFNYCRDSMMAALAIIRALKLKGRRFYDSAPVYHQERAALQIPAAKAQKGIKKLASKYKDADFGDGLKVILSKSSWVLIRPSGTESAVRVSAEAETYEKAAQIVKTFSKQFRELSG
jgi:phosphomannomutase